MDTRGDLNYRLFMHKETGFTRTSFQSEFSKYNDIQNGDVAQVKKNFVEIRKNFNKGKGKLSDNPINNIRYHMIISTAMTARLCIEAGMNHDEAYTLSDIFIQRVDKLSDFNIILDLFEEMQLEYAGRMKEIKSDSAYSIHVKKTIDYIYDHLHEKITIAVLADYVDRNPSYLSKLFAAEVGTPIHEFILDTRIATAKNILQHSDFSYIDIAIALGFSSQSAFVNVFSKKTGCTPKQYRTLTYNKQFSNL